MTTPSLSRLLISHITLRGPELAQLYALIAAQPGTAYDDLVATLTPALPQSAFGLEEAPLREALNFLLVAGLVEQQGASRRKASFRATPLLPDAPFALLMLHHILMHHDERQRAPALIYRQLVAEDTLACTVADLRDRLEHGPYRRLFAWTGEKVLFWSQLTDHLGLVRRLDRTVEVLCVPQLHLVLAALRWAAQQTSATDALDPLLRMIDTQFFACFTARGRVHQGLAQALVALHRLGHVQLTHSADAARSLLLGEWRVSEVRVIAKDHTR